MKKIQTKEAWIEEAKEYFGEDVQIDESSLQEALIAEYQQGTDSWVVKLLSIFGGLFASGTFIGYFVVTNIFQTAWVSLSFGLIMIALSIIIAREMRHLVLDTTILCSYFAGFFLVGIGLHKMISHHRSDDAIALTLMLFALLSFLFSSRPMITLFAILIFEGAAYSLIIIHDAYDFLHVFFAVNVFLFFMLMKGESFFLTAKNFLKRRFIASRYAILSTLWLANYCWMILSAMPSVKINHAFTWISSVIAIVPLIWVILDLGKRLELKSALHQWLLAAVVVLVLLPTIHYPAIAMSLMMLLFSYRIKVLIGIVSGALGLVFFIGQFYYDLHNTLLEKSYMMFGTGVAFLVLLLLTRKKFFSHEDIQ